MSDRQLEPFLRWAGGKRWFAENYMELLPKKFNRYIEPFLGSGAIFFAVKPKTAILGDVNKELIETYVALKTNWRLVLRYLREHSKKHGLRYYKKTRSSDPRTIFSSAARFLYLNRTCWNGLYRVNTLGKFNVPMGTKRPIVRDTDNFEAIAAALKNADLKSVDFETTIDLAE